MHTSGHGSGSMAAACNLGRGGGSASGADSAGRTLGRGSRSASAAASRPIFGGLGYSAAMAPSSIDGSGGAAFLGPATAPSLDVEVSALDVAVAAPARTLGRGGFSAPTALSLGRGGGSALTARSLGRGGSSAAAGTHPTTGGVGKGATTAPSSIDGSSVGGFPSIDGFSFPHSPAQAWFDAADSDPSSPVSWDKDPRPSGGFMSYFGNQPHNFHLVGAPIHNSPLNRPLSTNNDASSQPEIEILLDNDNVRTEKRILWTEEEDLRLMSAWIEHSIDSTCGADKGGNQYWGEVVESYNKTTPPLRKRNLKQCKDRWHKINRWTDLFECAYVKARRVFTSGYSDQTWIDAAYKFYVEDNKDAKLGPFVGIEKAAKKAALAAKGKSKGSSSEDDGNSKEFAIDLDKLGKFQEETNANRMKILELQQKLSSEKLETTKLAHLTAQETKKGKMLEKESKMMEAYNSLILQDTSSMSDVEKAERVAAMKCLRKAIFPESD
ncbi:unnamed protein product [Miscanthus lutarioriparius]|uniref:Myb-like domain-containing protein n=1 Tax=Miscanthus lutarioriparius TaxID=422564 RepID=A0A811MVL3_9POAL|nr:unnamed protein product [Miscanthus lutarioriparius]